MPGTIVDMHMHTLMGAHDSSLHPDELAAEAKRVGLSGVNITEHDRVWDRHALERFGDAHPSLLISNGMEVSTDHGHVIAVGLPGYVSGIHRLSHLRTVMDDLGGFLILAHPFRYWFDPVHFRKQGKPQPELVAGELAKLPAMKYVDALEVLNGACTDEENIMALRVANVLGKPGTGGSDCHSPAGIGIYCTVFEKSLETPAAFLSELRAGRFEAGHGLTHGRLRPFGETSRGDSESEETRFPPG